MGHDMVAIPADAPHPHNAEIWMNYLPRPEVIADDPSVKSDQAAYPEAETRPRLVTN
jgi:spermidine/putrescine-binding protein